jgi:hypothetical protein
VSGFFLVLISLFLFATSCNLILKRVIQWPAYVQREFQLLRLPATFRTGASLRVLRITGNVKSERRGSGARLTVALFAYLLL